MNTFRRPLLISRFTPKKKLLWWRCSTTTVLLTRHAERDNVGSDPHLNAAGQARAQNLIEVAGAAGVRAIFTSQFVRTQETAQPLATHRNITPTVVNFNTANPQAHAQAIVDQILASHEGRVVLVVGHTNTLPTIIDLLGGGTIPAIGETEFDNLFVVTKTTAVVARLIRAKYGAPT